jgi:iron complex outermembrane receptor protein
MLGVCGAALTASASWAQTAPGEQPVEQAADDAALPSVEEIIVTAQRREQRLQDVPVSITAFGREALEARNVTNFAGIAGFQPNVKIITYYRQSAPAIAIRGSVTVNPSPTFDPAVGLYVDGLYVGKSYGSLFDQSDLERIEVLRGPQGTLYGRNTLAGAINLITRKPTGEWGGRVQGGISNYDGRLVRASLDLPAFGDFAVKLTGSFNERDGFVKLIDNPFPQVTTALPRRADRAGDVNRLTGRAAVRWTPSADFTVDYSFDYSRSHDTLGYLQPTYFSPGGIFDPASPAYVGGRVGNQYFGLPFDLYVRPNERSLTGYSDGSGGGPNPNEENVKNRQHTLIATLDVGDTTLKSITGYRKLNTNWDNDVDGTPLNLIQSYMFMKYDSFSQEFQATGSSGPLNYTAGLYYFTDDGDSRNPQRYFGGAASYTGGYGYGTDSYAAYGQLEYAVTDAFTLIGGLRYTDEKKRISRDWVANFGVLVPPGTRAEKSFDKLTATATAKYDFSPDLNVYARYAQGFKSGGFNGEADTVAGSTTPYDPELSDSYEIGTKARLLDGRLQANVAYFYDRRKDMQLSVFKASNSLSSEILNAGKARIQGVEVELDARPSDWLQISGNIGTLDTKYIEYIDRGVNVADNRAFPSAPKFTASASVDATLADLGFGELGLIVDYTHSDAYYNFADPLDPVTLTTYSAQTTKAEESNIVDVRLRLTKVKAGAGEIEASLWSQNVFNEAYRTFGIDFGPNFGHAVISNYNPPRTYGLDVVFRF